ncbi:TIGR02391 family protein [Ancylobacter sp. A5.8]|uniref:TIGR02391 family protein n=1 Tax=Ancylobacter gelatini TaxID=2919920 RepID=UPI001F4DF4BE|nr:TIGR02391 family protein [Ancylobacter gelatini]MCJ8141638.1 TIGR02391 family protein [Ancylobacter gelatini]
MFGWKITQVFPEPDVLAALEPEELGLRLLPWLATIPAGNRQLLWAVQEANKSYDGHLHRHVDTAIREAWAWLEGQALLIESPQYGSPNSVRVLSRKAVQLVKEQDPRRAFSARLIPKESLHPSIREDVWSLFHRGKLDTAVFEAMKAVEVAVRTAARLSDKDIGVGLMRRAFDKGSGPLADMTMDEGEREMRAHLFAGAIGSYKNPHSHRNVALEDPYEAAEIILLANHLLRIVDVRAAAVAGPQPR